MDLKLPYIDAENSKTAYQKITTFLQKEGLQNLPFKPDFQFDEKKMQITATGSGYTVLAKFEESFLVVNVELGLLYRAFKTKVVALLETQLKKHL